MWTNTELLPKDNLQLSVVLETTRKEAVFRFRIRKSEVVDPDPDPPITKQSKPLLSSVLFCDFFMTFYL
jgi:hypothetical protein